MKYKTVVELDEKEISALMWAAGALDSYLVRDSDKATKKEAKRAIKVIREIYFPCLMKTKLLTSAVKKPTKQEREMAKEGSWDNPKPMPDQ
jgi:hypothetical protein